MRVFILHPYTNFEVIAVQKIWRTMCVGINGPGDFEAGMRVASEVGNLHSEFGHAKPSGSRVIRYVPDGRREGRTDESKAYCGPFLTGGGIINM